MVAVRKAKKMLRILLVDDSVAFLDAVERTLNAHPRCEVVGRTLSGADALAAVAKVKPDLVLMDLAMPGTNGLTATMDIKALSHPPAVVILTLHDSPEFRAAAAAVGADGFVDKLAFTADLVVDFCGRIGLPDLPDGG